MSICIKTVDKKTKIVKMGLKIILNKKIFYLLFCYDFLWFYDFLFFLFLHSNLYVLNKFIFYYPVQGIRIPPFFARKGYKKG